MTFRTDKKSQYQIKPVSSQIHKDRETDPIFQWEVSHSRRAGGMERIAMAIFGKTVVLIMI